MPAWLDQTVHCVRRLCSGTIGVELATATLMAYALSGKFCLLHCSRPQQQPQSALGVDFKAHTTLPGVASRCELPLRLGQEKCVLQSPPAPICLGASGVRHRNHTVVCLCVRMCAACRNACSTALLCTCPGKRACKASE